MATRRTWASALRWCLWPTLTPHIHFDVHTHITLTPHTHFDVHTHITLAHSSHHIPPLHPCCPYTSTHTTTTPPWAPIRFTNPLFAGLVARAKANRAGATTEVPPVGTVGPEALQPRQGSSPQAGPGDSRPTAGPLAAARVGPSPALARSPEATVGHGALALGSPSGSLPTPVGQSRGRDKAAMGAALLSALRASASSRALAPLLPVSSTLTQHLAGWALAGCCAGSGGELTAQRLIGDALAGWARGSDGGRGCLQHWAGCASTRPLNLS